jgi:hypothetical protein
MVGSESLCFLDAYSGYNKIKMAEEDEEKTAFITLFRCFCYTTMTFTSGTLEPPTSGACKNAS